MPSLEALLDFLTNRAHTLELVEGSKGKTDNAKSTGKKIGKSVYVAALAQSACVYCESSHHIAKCEKFQELSASKKWEEVKKRQLCLNCLRKGHYVQACTASACKICSKKHNTMLHSDKEKQNKNKNTLSKSKTVMTSTTESGNIDLISESKQSADSSQGSKDTAVVVHTTRQAESIVFIATAKIYVINEEGQLITCRAILDPGSQSNIITKEISRKLKLKSHKITIPISGINQTQVTAKESVVIRIRSMHSEFSADLNCLIMPNITEKLPQVKVNTCNWNIPEDIELADPEFNLPAQIDILIGSNVFWKIICPQQKILSESLPRLQETLLGWIVGGELVNSKHTKHNRICNIIAMNLSEQLEKFWSMEEPPIKSEQYYTPQEQKAEDFFIRTVQRDDRGRYIVRLPQDETVKLGESKDLAKKRFLAMERKLNQQATMKEDYNRFIREYEALGHLSLSEHQNLSLEHEHYYLPHQPVIKATS
ncbi:uncharacterized protein [Linepithema humile]|uniref:uncharacterized protein n=1 Tax=Linepithema humile TaxID=83485 RepID=UPI00351E2EAA